MRGKSSFTLEELESLYAGDEAGMREILSLFEEDAPERLAALKEGLAQEEIGKATSAAHGLANLLGALRNHHGVAAARETERALSSGNLPEAREKGSRCESEVEATLARIVERKA